MITRQFRWSLIGLSVLLIMFASSCHAERPPQEIARKFWDALKVQNIESARKYATVETRSLIDTIPVQFHNADVSFGKIIIDGNTTTIETTLHIHKNGAETTLPIHTVLEKENDVWRVDYQQTMQDLKKTEPTSDISKDIQELGKKLSERMDETLGEIKEKIPEYQEKLKKLGETASKKMEEAWQRQVSEIRRTVEEFGKVLDEALKKEEGNDIQKEKPVEPPEK